MGARGVSSCSAVYADNAADELRKPVTVTGKRRSLGEEMARSLTARRHALIAGSALAALLLPATVLHATASSAASGAAHVSSYTPACVASSSYHASVTGIAISSVTFALDGRRVAKVSKPNSRGAFATRVGLRAGRAHRLTMTVDFTAASQSGPVRFQRTLARCAAKIRKREYSPAPEKPAATEAPLPFTG